MSCSRGNETVQRAKNSLFRGLGGIGIKVGLLIWMFADGGVNVVFGLIILAFGLLMDILAIVFAGMALSGMSQSGDSEGQGFAIGGLIVGILDILFGFVVLCAVLAG